MTLSEVWTIVLGTVQGLGGVSIFLLVVMIGFCLLLDWTKFRPTRHTRTIRNLDELAGAPVHYLAPDAPSGPTDQLAGSVHRA